MSRALTLLFGLCPKPLCGGNSRSMNALGQAPSQHWNEPHWCHCSRVLQHHCRQRGDYTNTSPAPTSAMPAPAGQGGKHQMWHAFPPRQGFLSSISQSFQSLQKPTNAYTEGERKLFIFVKSILGAYSKSKLSTLWALWRRYLFGSSLPHIIKNCTDLKYLINICGIYKCNIISHAWYSHHFLNYILSI